MLLKSRTTKILSVIFLIIIFTYSCKEEKKDGEIDEGHIKYDITYMGDSLDKFLAAFLPKHMTIKFKNNCTKNQMKGISGIVNFTHIKNHKEKSNITLVTIMDKKYKYIEKLNEPSLFFTERPDMKAEYTGETKKIAGYDCKKIHINIPSDEKNQNDTFDIYYTDMIKIKSFNDHTPFQSLDGVLLEFQLEFYGIPLKFKATEVKQHSISPNEFEIPNGYKRINKKTMKEIIDLMK